MTPNEVLAPVEALAGEHEIYSNDTTVNKHYGADGLAYCGYTVRYAFEMSGNGSALDNCPNTAWVPTFKQFCETYWTKVNNADAKKGDVFIYLTQHTGFVFDAYDGRTVITLEGNADVYATAAEAKKSASGSGDFEGIGYKKRYLSDSFSVYRPPYSDSSSSTNSSEGAEKVTKKGIDVSTWNGTIDWKKVKAAGIDFAIIRAGYGRNNIDSKFKENAKNAVAAGIAIGAYWFSYALTAEDAKKEADYLCDAVESVGVNFTYPLCFDYEYDSVSYAQKNGGDTSKSTLLAIGRAFLAEIEKRGYYAMNYTNIDFLGRGFSELTSYDIWLAQWSSKRSKDCGIWQYSSSGKVNGISGNVDMDYSYNDYPAIIKKAGLNHLDNSSNNDSVQPSKFPYGKASETTGNIAKGAKHDGVKAIQYALNKLGFGNDGTKDCDGIFGSGTEKAVRAFQRAKGLTADGIVGVNTRAMFKKLGY